MTASLTLVDQCRDMLLAGTREQVNTLSAAVSDITSTGLSFTYDLRGIQEGSLIEVDSELMYVVAVSESGKTATVIRGYSSSDPATHLINAVVTVNPKFSRQAIFDAQNDCLDDLAGEGLYAMVTKELTFNAAVQGYNLTGVTDVIDLYQVSYQDVGPEKAWPIIPKSMVELRPYAETDDFASGFAVIVHGYAQPGRQLRVQVKAPFTRLASTADDVNTVSGLRAIGNPLLKFAAAMKLCYFRETMRSAFETQGDSRRAAEVPMGAQITAARGWQGVYDRTLKNALRDQDRRYQEARYG